MHHKLYKIFASILLVAALMVLCASTAFADGEEAKELTSSLEITSSGGQSKKNITDDSISTFTKFSEGNTITLKSAEKMSGVYIMWNKIPGEWSYTADGTSYTGGENRFLHEYIALETPASEFVITIPAGGAQITDVYAFADGELPDWVQVWEKPCETADILLLSTHSDDEQLFFAGILPYYAIERDMYVQVVYLTHHWDTTTRPHEQLNGLWTVGIKNYPIISEFIDDARSLGNTSESRATVLKRAQSVYNETDWVKFQVELIRRFKPQVVIDHDLNGEYRHGAHILNSNALMTALTVCNDPEYDPDSADKYGLWDVPKTYFHLYEENPIVMDWDTPYESMSGKTPFEMSKLGYACHLSQQWTWFTDWISKDKATDIATYSPCEYGLYRSTVGEDVEKNDFMENLTPYAVQIAQKEEEERLKREEEERKKAEEEAAKLQQQLEQEKAEQSSSNETEEETKNNDGFKMGGLLTTIAAITAFGLIIVAIICIIINIKEKKRKKHRRRKHKRRHREK